MVYTIYFYYIPYIMKLIEFENYEIKVSDEALLVKPIRKLFHQDRSTKKEQFLKQMSVLFFVYSPSSNYMYITNEKDRLKAVLEQEGIEDFTPSTDFKEAVEIYKKLNKTPEGILLERTIAFIDKTGKQLDSIDYDDIDEIDKRIVAMKNGMALVSLVPKLMKDLSAAKKAIEKELAEQNKTRGNQELTIFDIVD